MTDLVGGGVMDGCRRWDTVEGGEVLVGVVTEERPGRLVELDGTRRSDETGWSDDARRTDQTSAGHGRAGGRQAQHHLREG